MITDKSYSPWPGIDETIVVQEMVRDYSSGQWHECREFVRKLVQVKAKNIHEDDREDIIQDTMIRLAKSLATFQYQCTFKTWIFGIVNSCIIDAYRKSKHVRQFMAPLSDPGYDIEYEDDPHEDKSQSKDNLSSKNTSMTAEDEIMTHDELDRALAALQEYVSSHAHATRNGRILNMVLFENRSLEETAQAVGCSAPVVGYVVRSARRYVRDRFESTR